MDFAGQGAISQMLPNEKLIGIAMLLVLSELQPDNNTFKDNY